MNIKHLMRRTGLKKAAKKDPELNRLLIYRNIDVFKKYRREHADCIKNSTVECCDCHSTNIHEWGLTRRNDNKRVYSCQRCGKILFRRVFVSSHDEQAEPLEPIVKQANTR